MSLKKFFFLAGFLLLILTMIAVYRLNPELNADEFLKKKNQLLVGLFAAVVNFTLALVYDRKEKRGTDSAVKEVP
jgi:hypothetical protein